MSITMLGLGTCGGVVAQDGPERAEPGEQAEPGEEQPAGTVVTLEIGRLGGSARAYEIERVADGPPPAEPQYLEVDGVALGVAIGVLDREQLVVEVHLFRAAGEPMAQILVEPGVTGYAEHDESTAFEVRLQTIAEAAPESENEAAPESDQSPSA